MILQYWIRPSHSTKRGKISFGLEPHYVKANFQIPVEYRSKPSDDILSTSRMCSCAPYSTQITLLFTSTLYCIFLKSYSMHFRSQCVHVAPREEVRYLSSYCAALILCRSNWRILRSQTICKSSAVRCLLISTCSTRQPLALLSIKFDCWQWGEMVPGVLVPRVNNYAQRFNIGHGFTDYCGRITHHAGRCYEK